MKVVLIPCGRTEWHEEGRLLGRVDLPVTQPGQEQYLAWAQKLAALGLGRILHGPDELSAQTAAVLARQLSAATKAVDDLVGVDIGLWAGLTEAQLKKRYASAHRELGEAPLNVVPPNGEGLSAAAKRLRTCFRKQAGKNGVAVLGVVLRPLAFVLLRCTLEGRELKDVWEELRHSAEPVVIDEPALGRSRSSP